MNAIEQAEVYGVESRVKIPDIKILHYVCYVSLDANGSDDAILKRVRIRYPKDYIKKIEKRGSRMIFKVESPIGDDV